MLKYANAETKSCLLDLYNEMVTNGYVYADWRKIYSTMKSKAGELKDPPNYRPILILNVDLPHQKIILLVLGNFFLLFHVFPTKLVVSHASNIHLSSSSRNEDMENSFKDLYINSRLNRPPIL